MEEASRIEVSIEITFVPEPEICELVTSIVSATESSFFFFKKMYPLPIFISSENLSFTLGTTDTFLPFGDGVDSLNVGSNSSNLNIRTWPLLLPPPSFNGAQQLKQAFLHRLPRIAPTHRFLRPVFCRCWALSLLQRILLSDWRRLVSSAYLGL